MTIRVTEKPPTFNALQWVGNNKREIDDFAGTKSTRDGDKLFNDALAGRHVLDLNDWLVEGGPEGGIAAQVVTDDEFNGRFTPL